jgi:iron complex outermembrane receptor protein
LRRIAPAAALACVLGLPSAVHAQRVNDNAVASAEDAFGGGVGQERIGLYSQSEVRGFSPITAGNIRLEGLYIDRPANFTDRMTESHAVRVGLAAQNYLFPAPTGVVDYRLRTSGSERVVSVMTSYADTGHSRLEIDGQFPISPTLSLAAGVGAFYDEFASGADGPAISHGFVLRWTPNPQTLVAPFLGQVHNWDRETAPLYVGAPGIVPPAVKRLRLVTPRWADNSNTNTNYGVLGRTALGSGFELAAGLFRSTTDTHANYVHLLTNVQADGSARRRIGRDPGPMQASTSGEFRVSRPFVHGDLAQAVHLSLRARQRDSRYGGGVNLDYGPVHISDIVTTPEPEFALGPRTRDEVRQWTAGLAYDLRWRGRGSLMLGLQRTDYRRTVLRPGTPETVSEDPAWLYNAAASWTMTQRLALYGSVTRGLEESGVAPDSAANRAQALPAIITDQWDAGVRVVLTPNLRLVAGGFEVKKPYFAPDAANVFRELGAVRHRGVEVSLTGAPIEGLTLVAGAVLMQPRVTGDPVREGRIGPRPVGQAARTLTLSGAWQTPMPGLQLTFGANHHGARIADQLNRSRVPAATITDLGIRYRFDIGETPALLRVTMTNVTNEFDWRVVSSGTFDVNAPRTTTAALTVDF